MQVVSAPPNEAVASRIEALSVLPVFLDLSGKRAMVAGGTAAAAWKAELLAAAGACVEVFAAAEKVSEEMAELAARTPGVILSGRSWDVASLRGAAIAVADAESDGEAAAFADAARAAGAACNIIDRPAHCQFQFGTIVNRSPVVIGISTSGAAPILGQAIRRRIEALLSPALAEWAALAQNLRHGVAARVPPGPARRVFWERFVDLAFGPAPHAGSEALMLAGGAARQDGHGCVTFIGAGSDPELLTLKAVRALQAADLILYDERVSDAVLELARREAKRILVRQQPAPLGREQHETADIMIALAKDGRRVVRLKSGDPMIFGRADEEIAALEAEHIDYDVILGITAGLAWRQGLTLLNGVAIAENPCAS